MPDLDILDKSQDDALAEVMEKIIFPNDEHLADCYHYIRISKKHVDQTRGREQGQNRRRRDL